MTTRQLAPAETIVRERVRAFIESRTYPGDWGQDVRVRLQDGDGRAELDAATGPPESRLRLLFAIESLVMECVGRLRLGDDT